MIQSRFELVALRISDIYVISVVACSGSNSVVQFCSGVPVVEVRLFGMRLGGLAAVRNG